MPAGDKPFPKPFLPPSIKVIDPAPTPKIHLYTAGTPNGYKVHILLEELVRAYPEAAKNGTIAYDIYSLSFGNNDQKSEGFLKINPNGRIPAIVDDNAGGHNVFETASILIWLVEVCSSLCEGSQRSRD
jgi:glutathione S-transferase